MARSPSVPRPEASAQPAPLTCVVTGATSGIGQAIAGGLLRAGAQVILLARSEERAAFSLQRHARAGLDTSRTQVVMADLRSPEQTRAAARRLLELAPRLDVLVHCAGVWPARLERTEQGLETSFAVNALAPLILNRMLRARLAASATRVVQLTAGLYPLGRVDLARTPTGDDFHPLRTYANTKLCNILTTLEEASLGEAGPATFNLVHPGVVRTRLGHRAGAAGWLLRAVKLFWASPARGARAPLHLATSPALRGMSGRYFDRLREQPLKGPATDRELGRRLWATMLKLGEVD